MENPLDNERLKVIEDKVNEIFVSVEKTRKYFFWTMIITIVLFALPLIGLVFVVPSFMSSYSSALSGM